MPLQIDRQRPFARVEVDPGRRASLLGMEPIAALQAHDRRFEVGRERRPVRLGEPGPARPAHQAIPEARVTHGDNPSHESGRR